MTGRPGERPGTSPDPAGGGQGSPDQRLLLAAGQQVVELTLEQLWLRHFALGGDTGLLELEAYLAGMMPLPRLQCDLLAQVINERLDELHDAARIPYSYPTSALPPLHNPAGGEHAGASDR